MATIKITQLNDISNNISFNSEMAIVDVDANAGPVTEKVTVQNLGNYVLESAGGLNFPPAALASLSYSVVNAAQPNITSTGTLTDLTVSGNIQIGTFGDSVSDLGNVVQANYFIGDGSQLSNLPSGDGTRIENGNSEVVVTPDGNVTVSILNQDVYARFAPGQAYFNSNVTVQEDLSINGNAVAVNDFDVIGTLTPAQTVISTPANLIIGGGDAGQYLGTDGNGSLSWSRTSTIIPSHQHVSLYGSDTTGDGTAAKPFRTVLRGIQEARGAGLSKYTIVLLQGDYSAEDITLDFSTIGNDSVAVVGTPTEVFRTLVGNLTINPPAAGGEIHVAELEAQDISVVSNTEITLNSVKARGNFTRTAGNADLILHGLFNETTGSVNLNGGGEVRLDVSEVYNVTVDGDIRFITRDALLSDVVINNGQFRTNHTDISTLNTYAVIANSNPVSIEMVNTEIENFSDPAPINIPQAEFALNDVILDYGNSILGTPEFEEVPHFTSVVVTDEVTLPDVSGVSIGGGSDGLFLRTDGTGNLTWAVGSGEGLIIPNNLYVSSFGSDTNGSGTLGNPYATVSAAITAARNAGQTTYSINLLQGTYSEDIVLNASTIGTDTVAIVGTPTEALKTVVGNITIEGSTGGGEIHIAELSGDAITITSDDPRIVFNSVEARTSLVRNGSSDVLLHAITNDSSGTITINGTGSIRMDDSIVYNVTVAGDTVLRVYFSELFDTIVNAGGFRTNSCDLGTLNTYAITATTGACSIELVNTEIENLSDPAPINIPQAEYALNDCIIDLANSILGTPEFEEVPHFTSVVVTDEVTLPTVDGVTIGGGSPGEVLTTDGTGNLSWQPGGSGLIIPNNLYVSSFGSDTNGSGTLGNPYATVSAAITAARNAGQTTYSINLLQGTYSEDITLDFSTIGTDTVAIVGTPTEALRTLVGNLTINPPVAGGEIHIAELEAQNISVVSNTEITLNSVKARGDLIRTDGNADLILHGLFNETTGAVNLNGGGEVRLDVSEVYNVTVDGDIRFITRDALLSDVVINNGQFRTNHCDISTLNTYAITATTGACSIELVNTEIENFSDPAPINIPQAEFALNDCIVDLANSILGTPEFEEVPHFTSVVVTDEVTLPDVSGVSIGGGSLGEVLTTDGTGNLSWQPSGEGLIIPNNLYVSSFGSDTNGSGTLGNPYATVSAAITAARNAGQTTYSINLLQGTYSEDIVLNASTIGTDTVAIVGTPTEALRTLVGNLTIDPPSAGGEIHIAELEAQDISVVSNTEITLNSVKARGDLTRTAGNADLILHGLFNETTGSVNLNGGGEVRLDVSEVYNVTVDGDIRFITRDALLSDVVVNNGQFRTNHCDISTLNTYAVIANSNPVSIELVNTEIENFSDPAPINIPQAEFALNDCIIDLANSILGTPEFEEVPHFTSVVVTDEVTLPTVVSIDNLTVGNTTSSVVTVATLPTAVAGGRSFVNDSDSVLDGNSVGQIVSSGGSNTVPVWSDGTNWYLG